MDSNSKLVNQNLADVEDSEEILGTKIQNEQLKNELKCLKESVEENKSMANDLKRLKESHDHLLKKVNDLEKLVISQNQNKTQNEQGIQSTSNSEKVGNDEEPNYENPFCFEQPLKKIKLEDQSEEIQKLNQVIKDLKEENSTLTVKNTKLSKQNEVMQIQNETMIKNLKEDQREEIHRLNQVITDLKEDNLKLSNENTAMLTKDYRILQIQNDAVVMNLKEDKLRLLKENNKLYDQMTRLYKEMTKQHVANGQGGMIRRIQNPDCSVSILRTMMPTRPTVAQTSMPQQQVIQPGTRQVIISKDGKIIGPQLVQGQQVVNSPTNTNKISLPSVAGGTQDPVATPTMVASPQQQAQPVTPSSQQKVQIVRSADDKIQVRGLLPRQQLVQMPDGKLQIFSKQNATQQQQQAQPQQVQPQQQPAAQQPQQQINATPATPSAAAMARTMTKSPNNVANDEKKKQLADTSESSGTPQLPKSKKKRRSMGQAKDL